MPKIFLINVGANLQDKTRARAPIFQDGSFYYMPYSEPWPNGKACDKYPFEVRPFTRNMENRNAHCDPDWTNYTYGDYCAKGRGGALKYVQPRDTLLFWSLLWRNNGKTWDGFTGDYSWYLIGALRVEEILRPGSAPEAAGRTNRERAEQNEHFWRKTLAPGHYVFIGEERYGQRFTKAVPFHSGGTDSLMFQTVRSKTNKPLTHSGKGNWFSCTRACRAVWDLADPDQYSRAKLIRNAINERTGFNIFADLT